MLYNLIQVRRGKETLMMTDSLPKVKDRMVTLRKSQRKGIKGDKVVYRVEIEDVGTDKFKKKPHNINLSGCTRHSIRRVGE